MREATEKRKQEHTWIWGAGHKWLTGQRPTREHYKTCGSRPNSNAELTIMSCRHKREVALAARMHCLFVLWQGSDRSARVRPWRSFFSHPPTLEKAMGILSNPHCFWHLIMLSLKKAHVQVTLFIYPSSNTSMRNFILVGDTTTAVGMLRVGKTWGTQ